MASVFVFALLNILLWVLAGIVIYQALARRKEGKKLWEILDAVAKDLGLSVKEDTTCYGLPEIFGKIRGRRVFIHFIVGKGVGGFPKTAFGVEHKIRFDKKVMILSTKIPLPIGFRYHLNIANLHSPNYIVTSESKNNEGIMNLLFTQNVSNLFNNLLSKNSEKFLALFLEPGIAIFYTLDWEMDSTVLKNNLHNLIELVEQMEKNAPHLDPDIDNEILKSIGRKSYKKEIGIAFSLFIAALGFVLLALSILTLFDMLGKVFFVNIGIMLILIGTSRIYAAKTMENSEK